MTMLRRAVMVLNFFFVFSQLLLEFVDHAVQGGHQARGLFGGDEVVFMFGRNAHVDARILLVFEVHSDVDGRKSLKKPRELLHFGRDFGTRGIAQVTVSGGNADLHGGELLFA